MPEHIFDELTDAARLADIRRAIGRYIDAGMDVPQIWWDELNRRRLKELRPS